MAKLPSSELFNSIYYNYLKNWGISPKIKIHQVAHLVSKKDIKEYVLEIQLLYSIQYGTVYQS